MEMCFTGLVDIEIKTKSVGSTIKHVVSGGAPDKIQYVVDIYDTLFPNMTYYVTKGLRNCEHRLKNNISQLSSAFMPLLNVPEGLKVPVVQFTGKTSFITGVNLTSVKSNDDSSALSNFSLISRGVYLSTFLLVMMCILLVIVKVMIHRHHWIETEKIRDDAQFTLNRPIKPRLTLRQSVVGYLMKILNGTTGHFKIICLILAVTAFYNLNTFRAVYKTSKVVVDEPPSINSYADLIEHETAEPMFYDGVLPQSKVFKNAPKDSGKGQTWSKFEKMGCKSIWYEFGSDEVLSGSLGRAMLSMVKNSSVFIQTGMMVEVFRTYFCYSTPEGQRWRFAIHSDVSEGEVLLGSPISLHVDEKMYTKKMRRVFEHALLEDIVKDKSTVRKYATMVKPSSLKHQRQQQEACDDHFQFDSINSQLKAIPLEYYSTFFIFLLSLIVSAFILLLCEIACSSRSTLKPRRRIRPGARVFPRPVSNSRVRPTTN